MPEKPSQLRLTRRGHRVLDAIALAIGWGSIAAIGAMFGAAL